MHKLTRMRYSRDDWKDKAKNRADAIREFRKKISKKDEKIIQLEEALTRIQQQYCVKKKE